ncbi:MAG: hypothetical protein OXE42_02850 [Gammaproteobacteria bacterium]|nr:hypothetical protein [Gammaproteobacteria bacterium]
MSKVMNDRFHGQRDALVTANNVVLDWQAGKVKGTLAGHLRAYIVSTGIIKDAHMTPEYIEGYNEVLNFLLNLPEFPKD